MNLRGQLPGSVQKAKGTDKEIRTFLCGEAAEATGHQRLGCPQLSLGGELKERGSLSLGLLWNK